MFTRAVLGLLGFAVSLEDSKKRLRRLLLGEKTTGAPYLPNIIYFRPRP